jgi:hypothetical protein
VGLKKWLRKVEIEKNKDNDEEELFCFGTCGISNGLYAAICTG